VFFGFGMLLIGAFHTDPVGGPVTFEGTIHGFASKAIFSLFTLALLALAPSIKKDPEWQQLYRYTLIASIVSVALGVLLYFFPEKRGWFGLIERLLVGNMIIWVEVFAVNLLRVSLRKGQALASEDKNRLKCRWSKLYAYI
jgi:hypothetical protein